MGDGTPARLRKWRRLAVTALYVSGCAQPVPVTAPAAIDVSVAEPFDTVWVRTIRALTAQRIAPTVVEKSSGLISATGVALSNDQIRSWIRCSGAGSDGSMRGLTDAQIQGTGFEARADISVLIDGNATSSTIRPSVSIAAKYMRNPLGRPGTSQCVSNGTLEATIVDAVRLVRHSIRSPGRDGIRDLRSVPVEWHVYRHSRSDGSGVVVAARIAL